MTHPKEFGGYPDRMNPPKDNTKLVLIMMGVSLVMAYVLVMISARFVMFI
jgi:hypothetical protein